MPRPLTLEQLAHELNSKLDSSIRTLDMAARTLTRRSTETQPDLDDVAQKLHRARTTMHTMAVMLERTMRRMPATAVLKDTHALLADGPPPAASRDTHRTASRDTHRYEPPNDNPAGADEMGVPYSASGLGVGVPDRGGAGAVRATPLAMAAEAVRELLSALAAEHDVRVELQIQPPIAELPFGPLGTVLENGLRNAITACCHAPGTVRSVRMLIGLTDEHTLLIQILDTGPGLPSGFGTQRMPGTDGHGHGLTLSRGIVEELGGALRLRNRLSGPGALLEIRVPVASLESL